MPETARPGGTPAECGRAFDESLLTGYLDGVLTQEDEQRVRLHLETCESCGRLMEDLETMRSAAINSEFRVPSDDQWNERRRGAVGGLAFGIGWLLVVVWVVGVAGFALAEIWRGSHGLLDKLVVFGGLSGGALLFLSVLIDRLRSRKTDRYRRVQK